MKSLLLLSLTFLLITFSDAQAQVQKFDIPDADSLSFIKPMQPFDSMQENISDMPVLYFPKDAKMLVWWPGSEYYYNMPNLLKSKLHQPEVEILNGKELKGENLNQ